MARLPEYIAPPIETDPDVIAAAVYQFIQTQFPGWAPADGNFETILTESHARIAAEIRDLASAVATGIFQYFGGTLIGIPRLGGAKSSVATTWQVVDDQGYTIPAGTNVAVRKSGTQLIQFSTINEVTIPAGATSTTVGEVIIVSIDPGVDTSGIIGDVILVDALSWVQDIGMSGGSTAGGVDPETPRTYLDRLATELQLLTPRPILPRDFAMIALDIPGVWRALAIDGYNPNDGTFENERMTTVVAVDSNGQPVGTAIRNQVDESLEARREINFVIWITEPTYTLVDVTFSAVAYEGYDPNTVHSLAIESLRNYLSPKNWGLPLYGNQRGWILNSVVRLGEIYTVLNNTPGLDYVTNLTIGANGGAQTAANLTMTGVVSMPMEGTLLGTVVAP